MAVGGRCVGKARRRRTARGGERQALSGTARAQARASGWPLGSGRRGRSARLRRTMPALSAPGSPLAQSAAPPEAEPVRATGAAMDNPPLSLVPWRHGVKCLERCRRNPSMTTVRRPYPRRPPMRRTFGITPFCRYAWTHHVLMRTRLRVGGRRACRWTSYCGPPPRGRVRWRGRQRGRRRTGPEGGRCGTVAASAMASPIPATAICRQVLLEGCRIGKP